MAEQKKERCEKIITSIDLTHNSWKAWKTIKCISKDPTTPPCLVNANQVGHQLLVNGIGNMPTKPKRPILTTAKHGEQSLGYPFTEEEYSKGIATLKNNKAAGIDDVLVEQLKHPESLPYLCQRNTLRFQRAIDQFHSYGIPINCTNDSFETESFQQLNHT